MTLRLYSVFCVLSHLLSYKMNFQENALLTLRCCQFCFFTLCECIIYMTLVYIFLLGALEMVLQFSVASNSWEMFASAPSLAVGLTWSLLTKQMVNARLSFCCCECKPSKCAAWHPFLLLTGIGVFANLREDVKLGMENNNKRSG